MAWTCQSPRISRLICRGGCRRGFGRSWAKALAKEGKFVFLVNEGLTPNALLVRPQNTLFARAAPALARSLRRYDVLGPPIHRDIARLRRHALEPGTDLRKGREVVIARMREVGVGIERDVGDAVTIAHKIAMVLEMIVHHGERAVTFLHPILERVLLQLAAALDQRQPEIGGADIGLDAVLLEEHPLQRFGAIDAVLGPQ